MASAAASNSENNVKKIYNSVIEEVLMNVREAFLDEGYDEALINELKTAWESKLNASRAVSTNSEDASYLNSLSSNLASAGPARLPIAQPTHHSRQINSIINTPQSNNSVIILDSTSSSMESKPLSNFDASTLAAFNAPKRGGGPSSSSSGSYQMSHGAQVDGQMDGNGNSSDEDEDEDDEISTVAAHADEDEDDEDTDDKATNDENAAYEGKEDPEPLNSEDDLTGPDSDQSDLFDTEHVIVCQYDKITRIKNRWKFHLKDGIMHINGKDILFSKANGDAEW